MVQSMTGYGRVEFQASPYLCTIEVRSVNHRFLDLALKIPRELNPVEVAFRKVVQGRIARGHVDVYLSLRDIPESNTSGLHIRVDKTLAQNYHETLRTLQHELGMDEPVSFEVLMRLKELVSIERAEPDIERLGPRLCEALAAALDELVAMRTVEGGGLLADIKGRLQLFTEHLATLEERSPLLVEEFREKLRQRVIAVLEDVSINPERLEQEVAYTAERQDVTEEFVRLHAHLEHFENLIKLDEPIGRKLDFLLQEIHREVNTISSKVGDSQMTQTIIEMKSLVEQVREQVQNLQ